MSKHLRSRMVGCLLTMAVAAIAFAPAANAAQTDPVIQAPEAGGTYLALGDSLAFGYQQAKVLACAPSPDFCSSPDTQFATGYVNDYAATFGVSARQHRQPRLPAVRRAPRSSTRRMRRPAARRIRSRSIRTSGQDPSSRPPSTSFSRSASASRAITVNIGEQRHPRARARSVHDGRRDQPERVLTNAPALFASINADRDTTPATLRQEGGVKHEIIVLGIFNVLYPAIFQQVLGQTGNPATATQAADDTDAPATQLDALAGCDRREVPRSVRRPDAGVQPDRCSASAARDRHDLHATAVCTPPLNDIHPTDTGYAALAGVVGAADGF